MIAEKKPALKKAVERLWTVSEDKSIRARMKSIRMFEMDQRVIRDEAVEEGRQKGRQEGRQEGAEAERRRIASLIKRGASIDTIKKALAKETTRPTKKRTAATRN